MYTSTTLMFIVFGIFLWFNEAYTQVSPLHRMRYVIQPVCNAPPDAGMCNGLLTRYYYDSYTRTCNRFWYTGCGGNRNQFLTREDCLGFCRGFAYSDDLPPQISARTAENICMLPVDKGKCRAIKHRFYYNLATGSCEPFVFGGCAGNQNNFHTFDECVQQCM